MSYSATIVKSLQRGTITIAAGANNSNTATITAVTTAKSLVIGGGWSVGAEGGATAEPSRWARVELTNSTTVTATRGTSDANSAAVVVPYQVLELY